MFTAATGSVRAGAEPPALGASAELAARAVSAQLSGPALVAAGARGLKDTLLPGPGQPSALLGRLQVRHGPSAGETVRLQVRHGPSAGETRISRLTGRFS